MKLLCSKIALALMTPKKEIKAPSPEKEWNENHYYTPFMYV